MEKLSQDKEAKLYTSMIIIYLISKHLTILKIYS